MLNAFKKNSGAFGGTYLMGGSGPKSVSHVWGGGTSKPGRGVSARLSQGLILTIPLLTPGGECDWAVFSSS